MSIYSLHNAILEAIRTNPFDVESGSITMHHDGSYSYTLKTKPRDAEYSDEAGRKLADMVQSNLPS